MAHTLVGGIVPTAYELLGVIAYKDDLDKVPRINISQKMQELP
jgi:hypothetical protein